ncbi:hypothetical protein DTL21_13995 [Bremerella cremea]|uniref:Uncharacterized protein n=1 Tax=Blastopirellula marina TaxID=124 RepID=A0A2S8FR13_9BACT|nr:hypothetical protein C5Y83_13990 [Blastopirellula marina]RCS47113.1 hypothetical protein DTL21_13995 [Bremerella cremea]
MATDNAFGVSILLRKSKRVRLNRHVDDFDGDVYYCLLLAERIIRSIKLCSLLASGRRFR